MSVDDESAVSRRIVANPGSVGIGPKWSPKRAYLQMYGFLAVLIVGIGGVALFLSVSPESETRAAIGLGAGFGFLILVFVGLVAYYWWHSQQKILIGVTGDGLTVNKRPGDVFPFSDMKLGPWGWGAGTMGTALHLRCGRHRFVLGGRDHRTGSGTRLDEAPVPGVDAWLWAAEFDQLLTMVGRRTELDVRPPTPGEPTRYVLFPNPLRIQAASASKTRKQLKLFRSASNLAIDVGADAIRVVDPNTNALIASASPKQVTPTPATYQYPYGHWYPSVNNVVTDFEMQYLSTAPELIVRVPGMQPLTIACVDVVGALGITRRFSWRDDVPVENEPAQYAVSGADWPPLVEKFGLAPYLERHGEQTYGEQPPFHTPPPGQPAYQPPPLPPPGPPTRPKRRRGRWGIVVGCSIGSALIIAFGTYFMWAQHFGVPARITVAECDTPSSHSSHNGLARLLDYVTTGDHCVGSPTSATQGRYVEFWGVYRKDAGHDIDVHITRVTGDTDEAVPDDWIVPPIAIGVGGVLGVLVVILIVRRLRPAPVAAGQPWPGANS